MDAGRVRSRRLRGRRRRARAVLPPACRAGDRIVGFASPGLRCNGYSLARARAARPRRPRARRSGVAGLARTPRRGAAPRRASSTRPRCGRSREQVAVHGFAHVTGGGLPGNIARGAPRRLRRGRAPRHVAGAADLRRDPGATATSPTTRWSTSSTSVSAWWPWCRRAARTGGRRLAPRASTPGTSARSSTATAEPTSHAKGACSYSSQPARSHAKRRHAGAAQPVSVCTRRCRAATATRGSAARRTRRS